MRALHAKMTGLSESKYVYSMEAAHVRLPLPVYATWYKTQDMFRKKEGFLTTKKNPTFVNEIYLITPIMI